MHFAFISYGARQEVERLMRDIESQKFQLKLKKKGEPEKAIWVTGQVREVLGVKEVVFPREYKDLVLSTMMTNTAPNRFKTYFTCKPLTAMLRVFLNLKPLPKPQFTQEELKKIAVEKIPTNTLQIKEGHYNNCNRLIWDLEYVSIMPLGLRDDADLDECKDMGYKGWNHESL